MRILFFLILTLAVCSLASADIVSHTSGNILGGSSTQTTVQNSGLDFTYSATGQVTDGSATITNASFNVGGDSTRFGFDATVTSGIIHANNFIQRLDVTGGTADVALGVDKPTGFFADLIRVRSDGVFDTTGSTFWTLDGDSIVGNPNSGFAFVSGDQYLVNNIPPVITGLTYIEWEYETFFSFSGAYSRSVDIQFISGTPAGVPEPSSWRTTIFGFFGLVGFALRRRRRS